MTEEHTASERDLVAGKLRPLIFWGLPIVALVIGGVADLEVVVWPPALTWMGVACLANARRCGQVHCYFTGPFFLLMAAGALVHGLGVITLGPQAWNLIGGITLVGGVGLTYGPELAWGRYFHKA